MPTCSACGADRSRDHFSTVQLKKAADKRRCAECIHSRGDGAPSPPAPADGLDGEGRLLAPTLFHWKPAGRDAEGASSQGTHASAPPPASSAEPGISSPRACDWPTALRILQRSGVRIAGAADQPGGRFLEVATGQSFARGDVVLRESPLVSVRFDEPWSALELALTSQFSLSKLPPTYRLLARALEADDARLLDPSGVVQQMDAHAEAAASEWNQRFCACLADALGGRVPAASVARLLAIIKTNAFGVYRATRDGLVNEGLGLYPLVALANHACDAAAVWAFEGEQLVLRATRALHPSDEVSDSYLLPRLPVGRRRQKLRESYRFECGCARCEREASDADALEAAAAEFSASKSALEGRMGLDPVTGGAGYEGEEGMEDMVTLRRCTKLLERLVPRGCPHPDTAIVRLKLGSMWWSLYTRGQAQRARGGARGNFPIAKGCLQQAVDQWRRARDAVMVSLGAAHPLLRELETRLETAGSDQTGRHQH
jgi:hypothetical protein